MKKEAVIIIILFLVLIASLLVEAKPFQIMMDWHTQNKAVATQEISSLDYQVYNFNNELEPSFTIDFKKGIHFWNPQIAIWVEDSLGNYITTTFVTNSTAKDQFYSGRSSENFKSLDEKSEEANTSVRRVNALPVWAFKRNIRAIDGLMIPHASNPLPDAISGATPTENFFISKSPDNRLKKLNKFKIKLEVNVAFDQNEHFSEYEYLDDNEYHSGSGLLGQPSLIYEAEINRKDSTEYYVMKLIGRGHHSGKTGEIITDMTGITTAKKIVERIVVGIKK